MFYSVDWEEMVYDDFNELEIINPKPRFTIEADTLVAAIPLAKDRVRHLMEETRGRGNNGNFIPSITAITDSIGVSMRFSATRHKS